MTTQPDLPPVTADHLQRAFVRLGWRDCTFSQAMASDVRRRVLQGMAATIRTREWRAAHDRETVCVRRVNPDTGQWCTQRVPGPYTNQQTICEEPND